MLYNEKASQIYKFKTFGSRTLKRIICYGVKVEKPAFTDLFLYTSPLIE